MSTMATSTSTRTADGIDPLFRQGRALMAAAAGALQALRLFPPTNDTVVAACIDVARVAKQIYETEQRFEWIRRGDFFFLNDTRLRLDLSHFTAAATVGDAFERVGAGGVEIRTALDAKGWRMLLGHMGRARERDVVQAELDRVLRKAVTLLPPYENESTKTLDARGAARKAYVYSVRVARDVMEDVRVGRAVNVRKVKRAVQEVVDRVIHDPTSMMGMTTLRDFDEYTFTHSVNVCIFSVIIGQRIGLPRRELFTLGIGGLLHDLGKISVGDAVQKPDGLTAEEVEKMREHPAEGLLRIFDMHGFGQPPYEAMLMAYEHHMKTDLSGYPRVIRPRQFGLYSRIVAVADGFDAATSARVYQTEPWRPEMALREMKDNPMRGFDPLIVKTLIHATGIYPPGQAVILDTHEIAVVIAPNSNPARVHEPVVRLLTDAQGLGRPDAPEIEVGKAYGDDPPRYVIKTVDPDKYGIDVAAYVA